MTEAPPDFSGLITPLCTPLTEQGTVDVPSLQSLVDFQLGAGAAGVFVLGSSGEAVYLDDRTRRDVVSGAREAVGGRGHLVVGALAPTIDRVLQQLAVLGDLGADAFVVTPPFYAVPSGSEILRHFRTAAAASPVPLFAYDIPGNVGYKLDPLLAVELLRDGTVAALKDSSGDIEALATVAAGLGSPRRARLLSGADTTALRALDAGSDGLIAGLANVRPDLFVRLLGAHREGATDEAGALQRAIVSLNELFRIGQQHGLARHASEIGGLKHVLRERGIISTSRVARPLDDYPAEAGEQASALMAAVDTQLTRDEAELSGR